MPFGSMQHNSQSAASRKYQALEGGLDIVKVVLTVLKIQFIRPGSLNPELQSQDAKLGVRRLTSSLCCARQMWTDHDTDNAYTMIEPKCIIGL